jgi:hypothetical protein
MTLNTFATAVLVDCAKLLILAATPQVSATLRCPPHSDARPIMTVRGAPARPVRLTGRAYSFDRQYPGVVPVQRRRRLRASASAKTERSSSVAHPGIRCQLATTAFSTTIVRSRSISRYRSFAKQLPSHQLNSEPRKRPARHQTVPGMGTQTITIGMLLSRSTGPLRSGLLRRGKINGA